MTAIRSYDRLSVSDRNDALTLLFARFPGDEGLARVHKTTLSLANGEIDPSLCLTAWRDNNLIAILIVETMPGSSASLWPIAARPHADRLQAEDALLKTATAALNARQIKVAQTIMPPDLDSAAAALTRNEFRRITCLWQMRCDASAARLPTPAHLTMEPQTEGVSIAFCNALMSTFEDGMDIPELNGIRTEEEIIAGHRSDSPDLSRWWLARWKDEPAGVLIISDGADCHPAELAYFGVARPFRRQGVGRSIIQFALQELPEIEVNALTLLVDERNRPAIDLYRKVGFRFIDSREVFLRINS